MKQRLIEIFDLMHRIETKGDSTLFMADCIRELANVINSMPEPQVSEEFISPMPEPQDEEQ